LNDYFKPKNSDQNNSKASSNLQSDDEQHSKKDAAGAASKKLKYDNRNQFLQINVKIAASLKDVANLPLRIIDIVATVLKSMVRILTNRIQQPITQLN
jgi:capsule polysaccharide export protein KpsE/RkpR